MTSMNHETIHKKTVFLSRATENISAVTYVATYCRYESRYNQTVYDLIEN
jgi:hypothetical protein